MLYLFFQICWFLKGCWMMPYLKGRWMEAPRNGLVWIAESRSHKAKPQTNPLYTRNVQSRLNLQTWYFRRNLQWKLRRNIIHVTIHTIYIGVSHCLPIRKGVMAKPRWTTNLCHTNLLPKYSSFGQFISAPITSGQWKEWEGWVTPPVERNGVGPGRKICLFVHIYRLYCI